MLIGQVHEERRCQRKMSCSDLERQLTLCDDTVSTAKVSLAGVLRCVCLCGVLGPLLFLATFWYLWSNGQYLSRLATVFGRLSLVDLVITHYRIVRYLNNISTCKLY